MARHWARGATLALVLALAACGRPADPAGGASPAASPPAASSPAATPPSATPAPTSTDSPTVTFAAAGDFSASPEAADVLAAIGRDEVDLTLAVGDFSYGNPGEEDRWCRFVTDRVGADHPFALVSGNHESNGLNGHIEAFLACLPNRLPGVQGSYGREYWVDLPQADPVVRFVMISPGMDFGDGPWSYEAGSPHLDWTIDAIDSARAAGIDWVVAGMHTPCLTLGQYGCEAGEDLTNALVDQGVDLVVNGHDHLYQRTAQLGHTPACPRVPAGQVLTGCLADEDGSLRQGAGTVFVTVGTGGKEIRDVHADDPEAGYFVATSGANREPSYGYLRTTVTPEALTATFVGVEGTFQDSFTIAAAPGR